MYGVLVIKKILPFFVGYDGEVPSSPFMERYQRAASNFHFAPRSPYKGYFFGERSHRSLDSLGG